jgi:hypothetical protein
MPVNGQSWVVRNCEVLLVDSDVSYRITNIPFHRRHEILDFLTEVPDVETGAFFLEDGSPNPGYLLEYTQKLLEDQNCPQCGLLRETPVI